MALQAVIIRRWTGSWTCNASTGENFVQLNMAASILGDAAAGAKSATNAPQHLIPIPKHRAKKSHSVPYLTD
jgi:hypothetical protein